MSITMRRSACRRKPTFLPRSSPLQRNRRRSSFSAIRCPLCDNPIRLAEELAMIDMISKGRLVSGFVRGGGQEQLAAGVNPAFNREAV